MTGDWPGARADLNRALELQPERSEARRELAFVLLKLEDFAAARGGRAPAAKELALRHCPAAAE